VVADSLQKKRELRACHDRGWASANGIQPHALFSRSPSDESPNHLFQQPSRLDHGTVIWGLCPDADFAGRSLLPGGGDATLHQDPDGSQAACPFLLRRHAWSISTPDSFSDCGSCWRRWITLQFQCIDCAAGGACWTTPKVCQGVYCRLGLTHFARIKSSAKRASCPPRTCSLYARPSHAKPPCQARKT